MRFSEAHHRQVVATSTASRLGRVEGFVLELSPPRVSALRLGTGHGFLRGGGGSALVPWSDLASFGQDAVTVSDDSALTGPRDADEERRASQELDLIGKPALLETGEAIGTVTDVEFDPASGAVRAVLTTAAEVPGEALVGLGGYAAVFTAPD